MSRMLGTGVSDRLARFLARRYGLLAADLLRLTVERHSDELTEVTLTLLVADSDLADPTPAMVNVPVLKYGDRCEAHGYDTYVLDGVTFHRATLGVCTDTSAPPRAWKLQSVMCASCSFATDDETAYLDHYQRVHPGTLTPR